MESRQNEIAIFVRDVRDKNAEECYRAISALHIPKGYSVRLIRWTYRSELGWSQNYAGISHDIPSKYKIFVNPYLLVLREDIIDDFLKIFHSDPDIGVIGLCGSSNLEEGKDSDARVGGFFAIEEGHIVSKCWHREWKDEACCFADAAYLCGGLLAVQYDLPWLEHGATTEEDLFLQHSLAYHRRDYRLQVPLQSIPWCLYFGADIGGKVDNSRKATPLLTLGVPTFNRSRYLEKCLHALCSQAGNDSRIEIFVSDNASVDETPSIVAAYQKKYGNVRYVRQETNIGGAANFEYLRSHAKGKFVMVLGDDDYLQQGVVANLFQVMEKNPDLALIAVRSNTDAYHSVCDEGLNAYVKLLSFMSTYITAVVFRTEYLKQVHLSSRWDGSRLDQVAVQLELLCGHPSFAILYGPLCTEDSGESVFLSQEEYDDRGAKAGFPDLGRVFIEEYLEILYAYAEKGLSSETIRDEKLKLLNEMILPWCKLIKRKHVRWQSGHVLASYDRFYQQEPYYDEGRKILMQVVQADTYAEDMGDKGI